MDEASRQRDFAIPKDLSKVKYCYSEDGGTAGYFFESEYWKDEFNAVFYKIGHRYSNYRVFMRTQNAYSSVMESTKPLAINDVLLTDGPNLNVYVEFHRGWFSSNLKLQVRRYKDRKLLYETDRLLCEKIISKTLRTNLEAHSSHCLSNISSIIYIVLG